MLSRMSISSRRTYDTDLITLRRIYAYDLSNAPFSTGNILTAVTRGVATFLSPTVALSSIGVPNLPAQLSTIDGQLLSTLFYFNQNLPSSASFFLPSTVTGLGSSGYVSTSYVTSTIEGLGTLGYLSSAALIGLVNSSIIGLASSDYISSTQLFSTITGLGSSGFISSSQLVSTIEGLGSASYISSSQLISTVEGIGSLGFVSSLSLTSTFDSVLPSTVIGLGSVGYVSTLSLISTVDGLGSLGYISSIFTNYRSTFTNEKVGNWSNAGFLYQNLGPLSTVQSFQFDVGDILRNQFDVSTTNLDIEIKANLQFGYYDARSIEYDFSTCLVRGVSLNISSIIAQENLSYYILNANPVNLPFFFTEKYRFVINSQSTISTLKNESEYSTLSLFHRIGISSPTTNQLFVYPAKPTSITMIVDNSTRTYP
jgi:hypothetical protein